MSRGKEEDFTTISTQHQYEEEEEELTYTPGDESVRWQWGTEMLD